MKQLPNIATMLYAEPWAVLPEVHATLCTQFRQYLKGPEAAADDPVGPVSYDYVEDKMKLLHPQVSYEAGVAVLPVKGVMGKGLSLLAMKCGGYDVGLMGQQLEKIRDDERVKALVIAFDTPGGSVRGLETAAKQIQEVRTAGKRIYAYTESTCASAGYRLAVECDEIHAEESATVGSISTILAGIDDSRAWEMEGLELKLFATGALKAAGHPGKKWTAEEEAFLWDLVNKCDADFKGAVRDRRGLEDGVMNGAFWQAKHAPEGVVDSTEFRTLGSFLEGVYGSL